MSSRSLNYACPERCCAILPSYQVWSSNYWKSLRKIQNYSKHTKFQHLRTLLWPWPLRKVIIVWVVRKTSTLTTTIRSWVLITLHSFAKDFFLFKNHTFWPFDLLLWPWPSSEITWHDTSEKVLPPTCPIPGFKCIAFIVSEKSSMFKFSAMDRWLCYHMG